MKLVCVYVRFERFLFLDLYGIFSALPLQNRWRSGAWRSELGVLFIVVEGGEVFGLRT